MGPQDCFWTAMKFTSETPDPRFTTWTLTQDVLESDYLPVPEEDWTFGDVVLLLDGQSAVHMCV